MENKHVEVMPKGQFELLTRGEQHRLMEMWRDQYTNKEIYEGMGYTSHQFYKLINKLGVKAKETAPSTTKLRTDSPEQFQQEIEGIPAPIEEIQNEEPFSTIEPTIEEQQATQAINISISDMVDKDKAEVLFQSVLAFLSTGGEYNLSITISK